MKFHLKHLIWFVTIAAVVCAGIGFALDSQRKARRSAEIERARLWKAATASVDAPGAYVYGKTIIETYEAKCLRVIDGDTLVVLRDKTRVNIRLDSIDSPEMDQPFGKKAKQRLSEWVSGKQITVFATGQDRYKHTLAFIEVDDFGEINKNLIADGLAWEYKKYSKSPLLELFETDARQRKSGLWSDLAPIPPWEWRKKK